MESSIRSAMLRITQSVVSGKSGVCRFENRQAGLHHRLTPNPNLAVTRRLGEPT